MGAAVKMDVELDGKPIGQTAANAYFYKEIAPGKHTLVTKTENYFSLEINAKSGSLLYV